MSHSGLPPHAILCKNLCADTERHSFNSRQLTRELNPSDPPDTCVCKLWQSIRFSLFYRCRQHRETWGPVMFLSSHPPTPSIHFVLCPHPMTHIGMSAHVLRHTRAHQTFQGKIMSETLSGSQEKSAFVIEGQIKLNFFFSFSKALNYACTDILIS